MAAVVLPDRDFLRQSFRYNQWTGELFWLPRQRSEFTEERIWRAWCTVNLGRRAGFKVRVGRAFYWCVMFGGRQEYQHRIIWKWMTGEDPPMIDHRDCDGLNNAWKNLRLSTKAQNGRNCLVQANKKSGLPKGVTRHRVRYDASIVVDRVRHRLGRFDTPEDAHAAYCEAAKRLHGEFFNPG
jgi:hypothetical protein